jgi:prevent-host-death family protein
MWHIRAMSHTWQLQVAKNKLSEVVDKALTDGPQTITRHGKPAVVVVDAAQFGKMTEPKESLIEFFARSPLRGVALDLRRSRDGGRDVDL